MGNGFDLNLGLKTSYKDFLEQYSKKSDFDSAGIKKFKDNIEKNIDTWANAELEFGVFTENFQKGKYEDFFECYDDFCQNLGKYLHNEEENLSDCECSQQAGKVFFDSLKNILVGLPPKQVSDFEKVDFYDFDKCVNYDFVTFNYTLTLDFFRNGAYKFLKDKNSKHTLGEVIHIHGNVHSSMVFGVNDESQIKNIDLFYGCHNEDIGTIIKEKAYELNQDFIEEKTLEMLSKSDIIYVYGMSLGKTDAFWWKKIIQLMEEKRHIRLIIHSYDTVEKSATLRLKRKYEREKKEEFLNYRKAWGEVDRDVFNRIYITRDNIFENLKNFSLKKFNK